MPTTTGAELRAERKQINTDRAARGLRDITVTDIAEVMGKSRQTVHSIENAGFPDEDKHVKPYREALYALRDGTVASREAVA